MRKLCTREIHGCPSCRHVQRVLDAYVDGETEPVTGGLVADHLERCRECAAAHQALRNLKARVTSTRPTIPTGDIDRLRAQVIARIIASDRWSGRRFV